MLRSRRQRDGRRVVFERGYELDDDLEHVGDDLQFYDGNDNNYDDPGVFVVDVHNGFDRTRNDRGVDHRSG